MQKGPDDISVLDRLKLAVEAEALPASAREHATHLIRRLSSPVRVACLGQRQSGKSELINMFAGRRVIPTDRPLPTLELVWGEQPLVSITGADGSVTDAGLDILSDPQLGDAAFVRIAAPIDILRRISLLEVAPEGDPSEQRAAIDWAIRRTDIALWCSQAFGAVERDLWSRVPDSLKDHAFLVLTMADKLGAAGTLQERIAELDLIVSEEFHSLFAVATLHALAACGPDGQRDEIRFETSGGAPLFQEVLRHADRGRRADMDSAYLFLSRYQVRTDPRKVADTARAVSRAPDAEETARAETVANAARPVSQPVPPVTAPPTQGPNSTSASPVVSATPVAQAAPDMTIFSDAVRFLRRRGAGLADTAGSLGPGNARPLIDQCVDTVEHLVDLFSQDESGNPEADAFMDDLAEAAEMMVLMQLEDGDAPAADAVTLLLQLRRDMETRLAA